MKTLKTSLLAIALMAGISGAFVSETANAAKPFDTLYNWTGASNAPQNPGQQLDNASIATATSFYGCNTGTNLCASGNKVSGPGPNNATISFH